MLRIGEKWWKFDKSGELSDIFYDNVNKKVFFNNFNWIKMNEITYHFIIIYYKIIKI